MTPSVYQQAIYDAVEQAGDNLIIEAVAGSGKTTTIVEVVKRTPASKRVLVVAFNKHIAEELKKRFVGKFNVEVATLNGFGWRICLKQWGKIELDAFKSMGLIRRSGVTKEWHGPMAQMLGLIKAHEGSVREGLTEIADKFDVEVPTENAAAFFAKTVALYQESCDNKKVMDFDDQIAMPILHNIQVPQYDLVVVDEAQDLSPVQAALVMRAAKRLIAVGDSRQAIYGFRGADPSSMRNLAAAAKMRPLPLSICYRCAPEHVELAKQIVPHIEPNPMKAPNADAVQSWPLKDLVNAIDGDYILCRTTAPLVSECMKLISLGRKATVKGRDIGQGLITFITKLSVAADPIEKFVTAAKIFVDNERIRLAALERENALQALDDKWQTLQVLSEGCSFVADLIIRINSIFSDSATGIIFCTVHRSKGLEAERVMILRQDLMPFPKAKKPWQVEQEWNLKYVALTRSKKELIFLEGK